MVRLDLQAGASTTDISSVEQLLTQPVRDLAERGFAALVEHSSDIIFVVDEAGILRYANPAASGVFGISPEDAVGTLAFRFLHPDDVDLLIAKHVALVESPGESLALTLRFVSVTGEVRVLETVATNCLDIAQVAGLVINGRDVTERNDYMTKLENSFDAITVAIANALDLRDPYTAGHQREVAGIATAVARDLALPEGEIKGIEVAATLHDIGKIAIPSEILSRPGRLSVLEFEIVKTHSESGWRIVADVPFPWPVAEMILQHHERLDGSGYPRGLRGDDILLGSRIIAVADVISAMSAHRPYRPAVGLAAALAEVESNRGRLYDPRVVDACLHLFDGLNSLLTQPSEEPVASGSLPSRA